MYSTTSVYIGLKTHLFRATVLARRLCDKHHYWAVQIRKSNNKRSPRYWYLLSAIYKTSNKTQAKYRHATNIAIVLVLGLLERKALNLATFWVLNIGSNSLAPTCLAAFVWISNTKIESILTQFHIFERIIEPRWGDILKEMYCFCLRFLQNYQTAGFTSKTACFS